MLVSVFSEWLSNASSYILGNNFMDRNYKADVTLVEVGINNSEYEGNFWGKYNPFSCKPNLIYRVDVLAQWNILTTLCHPLTNNFGVCKNLGIDVRGKDAGIWNGFLKGDL